MSEPEALVCPSCVTPLRKEDVFCPKCGTPRKPVQKGPKPASNLTTLIVVGLFVGGPLAFVLYTNYGGSAEGELRVSREGSELVIASGDCDALHPTMGAFVRGESGGVVVIEDPIHGTQVSLVVEPCEGAVAECATVDVPRESCSTFDAVVESAGWRMNHVAVLEGHVELDCTLEDGTVIEGNLAYDGCY